MKMIPAALAVAALAVPAAFAVSGCGGESSAPEGAKGGDIRYHWRLDSGDRPGLDELRFTEVWCRWQGDHVLVHVRVENPLVVPTATDVTPAYEIEKGGRHGTSYGSDRPIPVQGNSYTEVEIDAGRPEGVPPGTPISSCEPEVQGIDLEDEVDVTSTDDVRIVAHGSLDD